MNAEMGEQGRVRSLKRVLRRKRSQDYFKEGGWTTNLAEASTFSDVVQAAQACIRYGLEDVELAIGLPDEHAFFTILR